MVIIQRNFIIIILCKKLNFFSNNQQRNTKALSGIVPGPPMVNSLPAVLETKQLRSGRLTREPINLVFKQL